MRAVRKMQLSALIVIVGVAFLAATQLLPMVKSPQTLLTNGPEAGYEQISYAISGYRIPPVDQNSRINISMDEILPDPVFVGLYPGNGVTTGPIVYSAVTVSSSFFVSVQSPATQPYTLIVSSFNNTTYRLQVKGTWSPYYDISGYVSESIFVILVGIGGFFYYRETRKREEMEEDVRSQFQKSPKGR